MPPEHLLERKNIPAVLVPHFCGLVRGLFMQNHVFCKGTDTKSDGKRQKVDMDFLNSQKSRTFVSEKEYTDYDKSTHATHYFKPVHALHGIRY